jgi:hypothetical protein
MLQGHQPAAHGPSAMPGAMHAGQHITGLVYGMYTFGHSPLSSIVSWGLGNLYVQETGAETKRVAELLSQVPPEVKVDELVIRSVFTRAHHLAAGVEGKGCE